MKYIRTKLFIGEEHIYRIVEYSKRKDGIILEVGDIQIPVRKSNLNEYGKLADTIEELCDGFIFKDTEANELHFVDENSGISILGASLFVETLRGFIETDKGLIYVAKMNDKGELELLWQKELL